MRPFAYIALLSLAHQLVFAAAASLARCKPFGQDQPVALAIHLDNLEPKVFTHQSSPAVLFVRIRFDLRF